jgi:hypothetical protein
MNVRQQSSPVVLKAVDRARKLGLIDDEAAE